MTAVTYGVLAYRTFVLLNVRPLSISVIVDSVILSPKDSALWWLCRMWSLIWQRRGVRSLWVLAASYPLDANHAGAEWKPCFPSFHNQVFDATNTTRERRDLILAFVKENAFKVCVTWIFHVKVFSSVLTSCTIGIARADRRSPQLQVFKHRMAH